MQSKLLIMLALMNSPLLFSSEPPEKELNENLDPARLVIDSPRHERWYKKQDDKQQHQRNHRGKNTHQYDREHDQPADTQKKDFQKKFSLQLIAQKIAETKTQPTPASEQ